MVYCISAGAAHFPICVIDGSRSTSAICVRYTWNSKRSPVNYTDVVIELLSLSSIHLWYTVLAPHHIFVTVSWNFKDEINALSPVKNKHSVSHHVGVFSSKHSIMAGCASLFTWHANRGAPICGQLQKGCRWVGLLGAGGCPLNLLIAPWQSALGDITRSADLLHRETSEWLFGDGLSLQAQKKQFRWRTSYGLQGEQAECVSSLRQV